MKLCKLDYGTYKNTKLYTCSTCINDSFLDSWSLSWSSSSGKEIDDETISNFKLTKDKIQQIQHWSDQKFEENKIGWIHTFSDLETLNEYKKTFFSEFESETLSINFPETEVKELEIAFNRENLDLGEIGISKNLKRRIEENNSKETIGYDLIGMEDGGDFHSFHCHDLTKELIQKFGIKINEFGLIEENDTWQEMVSYMNDEENGFETAPWFYVKVNKVI